MGLWKKKAEKVSEYLEKIIDKRKDVDHIYKNINENIELSIEDEIRSIRSWIVEGYTGKLSDLQAKAIDQVISDRIRGLIPANKVVEVLDLSNNKFGVGLSFRASQTMAEKLELILNDDGGIYNNLGKKV